ncbi:unnamed protein product [Ceutorhynchus assimilis]|uniref:Uncharacterized protein n=1 Tax=Ceutorhynchus assimilis TaxID=467358 RepID=A0A9N9QMG9_9CUCU|nr:unnamed protein product [Ceutorhynchus assimilis]
MEKTNETGRKKRETPGIKYLDPQFEWYTGFGQKSARKSQRRQVLYHICQHIRRKMIELEAEKKKNNLENRMFEIKKKKLEFEMERGRRKCAQEQKVIELETAIQQAEVLDSETRSVENCEISQSSKCSHKIVFSPAPTNSKKIGYVIAYAGSY